MSSPQTQKKSVIEILTSLTPLILGILVTGVGAFFTHVYNFRQLQLNQLTALDKFRPLLVSEKPEEREFAYASFAALGYQELALKIINVRQDGAGRAVVLDIEATGDEATRAAATKTLSRIPAQVYLHIADEAARAKGLEVSELLRAAGLQPMGVENIAEKAKSPTKTQVRYFNDIDKDTSNAIVDILRTNGFADAYAQKISIHKARPGTIEIWFPKSAQ